MKLIAASTALLASIQAQSIDVLVTDLFNKIYQVSDDGSTHTVNIAPYFEAEYNIQPEGYTGEGSFGNGNGVIKFSETVDWTGGNKLVYNGKHSGSTFSHPWAFLFPEEVLNDSFEAVTDFTMDPDGVEYKEVGTINGEAFDQAMSFSVEALTVTSKKYSVDLAFSRSANWPSSLNDFWRMMLLPDGTTDVEMSASAKKMCGENPLDKGCSGKVTITGSNNGEDFGKNVAKYSVSKKKAQLTVTHDQDEVFWLGLIGIDTMEVLALKYKLNGSKAELVVQFVGPNGIDSLSAAGAEFIAPFVTFFGGFEDAHDAARAFAYADKICGAIQGKDYFNAYKVFEATKFESDLLAGAFGVKSIQGAAKTMCADINQQIEDFAKSTAPVVNDARHYVNEVTGYGGEKKFDDWFAGLNKEV